MLESFMSDKFTYKKIPLEEQKARGILGRLTGVIADTKNPTRNGRKYSAELWEKVFNNDIMKEKIANRCVFSELGHPVDREEVDLDKVCACLSEQPKLSSDGKIYGVFDILDTANGRILKTLCDYGTTVGVSSRGTGDLYTDDDGNEAVDPETYNCECFDIVIVPAVKEARLQYVTESLEKTRYNKTLRKSLQESLNRASEGDKKVMSETLYNLGIDLEDDTDRDPYEYNELHAQEWMDKHPYGWYNNESDYGVDVNELEDEEDFEEGFSDTYKDWDPADVELHKNTDWKARNYQELEVPEDNFEGEVTMYRHNAEPEKKMAKFTKRIRPNAIYAPYYAASEEPFEHAVGSMYDGHTHGKYDVHDRYEDQETYDMLSESHKQCEDEEVDERLISKLRQSQGLEESQSETPTPSQARARANAYLKNHPEATKDELAKRQGYESFDDIDDEEVAMGIEAALKDHGRSLEEAFASANYTKAINAISDGIESDEDIEALQDYLQNIVGYCKSIADDYNISIECLDEECNGENCSDKEEAEVVNDKSEDELVAEFTESLQTITKLKEDNLSLQEQVSVCNAKEQELIEQLSKYKQAAVKLSDTAKKVRPLKEENFNLTESLNRKDELISRENKRISNLTESIKDKNKLISKENKRIESLTESLKAKAQLDETVKDLNESLDNISKQLDESKQLVDKYRRSYKALKENYVAVKAQVYGIKFEDLKKNLTESYKIKDVDSICEKLVKQKNKMNKLPFALNENARISIKTNEVINQNPNSDDYISSNLLNFID